LSPEDYDKLIEQDEKLRDKARDEARIAGQKISKAKTKKEKENAQA